MRRAQPTDLPRRTLTAFEMQRRPAAFQRQAMQEPVTITQHGAPTLVAMSVAEYRRLRAGSGAKAAFSAVSSRQDVIDRLRAHRGELEQLGAMHVSLFGSVARDEAMDDSDVDVIVDSSDGEALGLFRLSSIKEQLERILGRDVDVISRRGLDTTTALKRRVAADLINVF